MDRVATELLEGITANYCEQQVLYERLYEVTLLEMETIRRANMFELIQLLQQQDELMNRIRELGLLQAQEKEKLQAYLPGKHISMDQLVCVAEVRVYLMLKEAMGQVAEILRRIEEQKNKNVEALQESLKNKHLNTESQTAGQ